MKILKTVEEVKGEGLESFMGEKIALHCSNYIYCGTLVGINSNCVKLDEDAVCVFETGPYSDMKWKDAQALGKAQYVMIAAIERFEAGK